MPFTRSDNIEGTIHKEEPLAGIVPDRLDKRSYQTTPWRVPASRMSRKTINPIRQIVEGLQLTPNPELEMIALSIGDPTVFGNLSLPVEAEEALIESARSGKHHGYLPSVGLAKARDAVAAYASTPGARLEGKDVVLTSGASHALDLAIQVLANPGQNIIIPRPGFSLYKTLAASMDIETRSYNLKPEADWEVDLDDLESLIDDATACIIINNPSNPCGSVYSQHHLLNVLDVASRHRIPLIADEIYANFVFEGNEFHPLASLTDTVPILACGGLAKNFLVPGWRLGWLLIHDRNDAFSEVRPGLNSLSQRILGPCSLVQGALPDILKNTPASFLTDTIKVVEENARYSHEQMQRIPGLKPVMPCGAMYMMVAVDIECFPNFKDDLDFTKRLVEEQSVFCLPAQCFQYPNYFRVVLTIPREAIEEACVRISEFCYKHYVGYLNNNNVTEDSSNLGKRFRHSFI